ncbi:MAG TPA: hypothetical protein VMF69_26790 [Gemmataceae bacterium]|nr:hypothetical protein [Gemmataceae bacterium]
MPKKASRPFRIAPLQRAVVEIVTDPAEIAAVEKLHKRLKRMQRKEAAMNGESVEDRPLRIAPLQRAVVEIVTDPAEIAAAEKLHKRLKREQKKQEAATNGKRVQSSPKKSSKRRRSSKPRP